MAITLDDLKELVKGENLRFLLDPDRPILHIAMGGATGRFNFVIILQDEGRFLQIRSADYVVCPLEHEHSNLVLRILAELNHRMRFIKFGLDPSDGEIVAFADLWIVDGTVTQAQFKRMMSNFVPAVVPARLRIQAAMESGKDPGQEATTAVVTGSDPTEPVSPDLAALLAELAKRGKGPASPADTITEI